MKINSNEADAKAKLAGIKGREYVNQNLSSQSRVEALINIYKGL